MIDEHLAVLLDSMRNAVVRAISLADRLTEDGFRNDPDAQAAAAMYLVVIGEAAIKIGQRHAEFALAQEEWPWDLMRALRNRIVHSYDTLNVPTVWSTVTQSLPPLLSAIEALGPLGPSNPYNAS
jgi:uncharacterized protein with HEPN domain